MGTSKINGEKWFLSTWFIHALNAGILGCFKYSVPNTSVCIKGLINTIFIILRYYTFSQALWHVYPLHLEIILILHLNAAAVFGHYVSNERRRECRRTWAGEDSQHRLRGWVCVCFWLPITSYLIITHTSLGGSKQQHNTQGNESLPARWESINASFSVSLCTF